MTEVFILLGLILLNGLFSMAEIALVSARKARLESQANKGDIRAAEALKLSQKPDTFLSTVQIGITLIGILTGIYSGESLKSNLQAFLQGIPAIAPYSGALSTAILVIVITYFSLVLGELVPKRIGLSNPEKIAKIMAGPMRLVTTLTYPFIWFLSKSTHFIVRLLNLSTENNHVTEEEIKAIINEGTEQGTIDEAEQEIIERVFHLGDRNITSLMTHRSDIVWFDLNDTEAQIKEKILREPHSVYPICDKSIDHLQGLVHIKDLYVQDDHIPFHEMMRPPVFVPENNSAYQVLEKFKTDKNHCAFIVDEYGTLLGMITLNDILEAIVGDLPQTDEEDYAIYKREDGSYLVDAQIQFYDFLDYFDKTEWMNEGDQEFDTLAGFILHELERIPKSGDILEWRGFTIEIVDMDKHRIDKILLHLSDELKNDLEEE